MPRHIKSFKDSLVNVFTLIFIAAYLMAFIRTQYKILSSKFKVALHMHTYEEYGVAHEAIVFIFFAVLLSLHLHTFLMFFTLVYLIFIVAYLIAFTPHTVHNFGFKVALRMCTYEKNGVAHEAIVIEWAVSSAS